MDENNDTLLDLDSIMERSMDDVEEAAGFITPTPGTFYLAIPWCKSESYTKKAKPEAADQTAVKSFRIKLGWQVVEQLEKSSPTDETTPKNGLFTEVFQFNDQGLGYFKARANDILETTAGLTVKETIKALNECAAVVKARVGLKETAKPGATAGDKGYINVQVKVLERANDIPFPTLPEKAA